ncbi:hypothetical protein [Vibrio parahaemolyticus]|uniref:hypothetical protein n=1 Tax=Vibrio parahaemolyticus TaxID=670 RepID=UPI001E548F7E|nr:hypothetical protein [Vibrio parahaemolyticus]
MSELSMIEHFRDLPPAHYPPDGCALLVRDAWQRLYGSENLPSHANRAVTPTEASAMIALYLGHLLVPVDVPEHGDMVVAARHDAWHCGVYTTEQSPGFVIHTLGEVVRIEPLNLFKRRFDCVEFYRYAAHHRVQTPDPS